MNSCAFPAGNSCTLAYALTTRERTGCVTAGLGRVSPRRSDHGGKHRTKRMRGPLQGMLLFQGGSIHPYVTEMLDKRDLTVKPPTEA